jgi:DNA-binding transcriptional regulator YiaG
MTEQSYGKLVKHGRKNVQVEGLKRFACDTCAGELISRAQLKDNDRIIDAAVNRELAQCVDADALRQLRIRHDLTQREASCLFGAGESSFAKWESGQCALSTPAALLVRCALDIPGVVEHLVHIRGDVLRPNVQRAYEVLTVHWSNAFGESDQVELLKSVRSLWSKVPEVRSVHYVVAGHVHKHTVRPRDVDLATDLDVDGEWSELGQISYHDASQSSSASRVNH